MVLPCKAKRPLALHGGIVVHNYIINHNLFLIILIIKGRFIIIRNKVHIHFTDKPVAN